MSPRSLWRSLLSTPRLWVGLLLWAVLVLVGLIVLRAFGPQAHPVTRAVATALAATALLALLSLALLALRFYGGVREVRECLFRGDYEAALEAARRHASVAVGAGFETALLRLLEFDRRRAEKVASATRLLDRLLREAPIPILLGDLAKNHVRFGQALRERFAINDDRFSIDAILHHAANEDFARLWHSLVAGDRTEAEAAVTLHLPVRQATQHLDLQLFAVQDDQGRIAYILGFAKCPPPPNAKTSDEPKEVTATE